MTRRGRRRPERGGWLKNRSTSDLLVLLIAGTICFSVLGYSLAVAVLVFVQPDENHGAAVALVTDTFQMLVGLLAGFIAGRSETTLTRPKKGGEDEADQPGP